MGREPRREAAEGSRRGAVRRRHQGEHAANRQAAFDPAREIPRPQKLRQLTVVRRELPGGGVGRGEQPGRERGPRQTPIGRPEAVQRRVVVTRQRGVERAPRSPGQQHRRAEFGCRVQDFGGVWLIRHRVPVFGVALAGHAEARDLERLAAACRPASTGGERLDEDLETLRVPKPTEESLLAGGLQEVGGVATGQTRLQQGHDVRIAERVEAQHGQGFVRRHRPQALPVARPEPVRGTTREPEPRPSECVESPPNLVERGPRIAFPARTSSSPSMKSVFRTMAPRGFPRTRGFRRTRGFPRTRGSRGPEGRARRPRAPRPRAGTRWSYPLPDRREARALPRRGRRRAAATGRRRPR